MQEIYRQTRRSAGADLTADRDYLIKVGETVIVGTGYHLPVNYGDCDVFFMLSNRSSVAFKKSLIVMNGVGVIDEDYRDEVKVIFKNIGDQQQMINKGERVAQLVAIPHVSAGWWDCLNAARVGGFGSTNNGDT